MRVLCYLNQFYGQIGGEAEAGYPMTVEQKPIGPCLALMLELKDTACECVATVICGDNYFAENTEACLDQFARILDEYHPDVVIAGPAFNAGRYGIACGQILKACFDKGIPAASGMYEENPGVLLYKKYGYIFPAAPNARGMRKSIQTFAAFLRKLSSGEEIGGPAEEGYFPREIRKNKWYTQTGAERAVNMLMKKVSGLPFQTELKMPSFTSVKPSAPIRDMKHATIAVMTSGGIVPTGNPDRLEALACTKYKAYSIDELGGEELGQVDVAHGGYDPTYAINNGNRVLPVDALMELKRQGEIGDVYPFCYVTVGNSMPVARATEFGDAIAREIKGKVDGVILTSTWGTDTRCGATLVKQIDAAGIPIVHIATITPISQTVGANRIVHGVSIPHPTAEILSDRSKEKEIRIRQIRTALEALSTELSQSRIFGEDGAD